jgi:hypothetical protein
MISTSGNLIAALCGMSANPSYSDHVRTMCREAIDVVVDMEQQLATLDAENLRLRGQAGDMAEQLNDANEYLRHSFVASDTYDHLRAILTRHQEQGEARTDGH